jgi:hypothetical protein
MQAKAELNNVELEIIGDYQDYQGTIDLITVADVLYDRNNIPLLEGLLRRADELILGDSRVKNFTHPGLNKTHTLEGHTYPELGGFDEFNEINIYRKR